MTHVRTFSLIIVIAAITVVAGCGGVRSERPADAAAPAADTSQRLRATATTSAAAAALSAIPDGRWSQRRVGYVNLEQLRTLDGGQADAIVERVLERGARTLRSLPAGSARTAVQLGDGLTVLRGDRIGSVGRDIGREGVAVGADQRLAVRLARPAEGTVITPSAQSAVQSCLGDTVAQTFLGPGNMGTDAAIGAGLAMSRDAPAGPQLRICGAPHYRRHIHETERRLQRLLRPAGDAAVIGEYEIGEREIVRAIVAVDDLPRSTLLGLLGGERQLRAVAWR